MPKVSIIIPVYNAQGVIERCVNSVLRQDFSDFELIIADDGSTDGSAAIIDRLAASDSRIRVIHKANTGVSDTRNKAIEAARGEYVQFADADDWMVPEATGALAGAMDGSGAGMVISDFFRVVGNRTSHKGSIDEEGLISREDFAEQMARSPADFYYGALWNKLFRKEIIDQYGLRMDENLQWAEDFIFNMEYILHIETVYVLRVPLYYYVKTEGGLISKGMNVPDIVRMKLNVIEYYTQFYKRIYSPTDYAAKRPIIYSFLLNFAHDDAVIPGLPGTKKLGAERTIIAQQAVLNDFWTEHFYEALMIERYLKKTAVQTGLDGKEIKILLYLQHFGSIGDIREISLYLGTAPISTLATLEIMALKKLILMDVTKPSGACLAELSEKAVRLLEDAIASISRIGMEDLSAEDAAAYLRLRESVCMNLKRQLEF